MDYSYSFSDELQQEWKWSERYASQPEILTLHQPRRRPLRPAPRHPALDPGDGGDLRRGRRAAGRSRPTAATASRRASASWRPAACRRRRCPTFPGLESFHGQDVSHRPLAARGRRLHRPARRRHRHRLLGHPVDPDHRRAGRAPGRLPAHAELQRPRAQRAARPGVRAAGQGELRRVPAAGARVARRLRRSSAARPRRWRCPTRSGGASTRSAGSRGGLGFTRHLRRPADSTRTPTTPPPSSSARRSARSSATRRWPRSLAPEGLSDRHQAHVRRHATTTRPSTATTSRWSTSAATPIEAITPDGRAHDATPRTRSTASCSPPASTR